MAAFEIPTVATERLRLRAFRASDLDLPLERAASFIRPDNVASKRVVERLGAVCERTFELRGSLYEYWVHHRGAASGSC